MAHETSGRPSRPALRLTVPNRREYIAAVADIVRDAARLAGFADEALGHVAEVATRITTGLMDPSLELPPEAGIDVACTSVGEGVLLVFHDDGPPFDPAARDTAARAGFDLLRPDSPDWLVFRNLGRGGKDVAVMLHRPGTPPDEATDWDPALVDGRFEPGMLVRAGRPGGRDLDLTPGAGPEAGAGPGPGDDGTDPAQRSAGPADGGASRGPDAAARKRAAAPSRAAVPPGRVRVGGDELAIGLFRPEQATAVSHCIYDAYHLTYIDESFYRPAKVTELNAEGSIVSAVATTPDGTVAGHAALSFTDSDRSVADLAILVTRRAWRGHGLAERLSEFLIDEARGRGLSGVYCDAVAIHPYSQRVTLRLGFTPCALRLAIMPAGWQFYGIDGDRAARGSALVVYKPLAAPSPATLRLPERHRELVERAFAWMGAPGRVSVAVEEDGLKDAEETVLTTSVSDNGDIADFRLARPGGDLKERLRAELHAAKARGVRVIEARVDLRAPGAADAVGVFEGLGFFVVGVRPGGPQVDWLLLQYLNGVLADYDGMVLATDEARELADRVRTNDPDA